MLRKSIFIVTLFFLVTSLLTGQTYSSMTTDKEIYDFLNWMTMTDQKHDEEPKIGLRKVSWKIASWDSLNFMQLDSLSPTNDIDYQFFYLFKKWDGADTIFKAKDQDFLFQQFISIKDTMWHEPFSMSKLLKPKTKKKRDKYYYSIPLFSIDRKYVIVQKTYYCGSLCAYGGYFIYKNISEGKWKYIMTVNDWMS